MKPVRTLILMASESRIRIAENAGVGKGVADLVMREAREFDDLPHEYADDPGRMNAAPGMARHDFDRTTPERDQKRHAFAGKAAEIAQETFEKGDYDRLIIAAPPKMLGALRDALPEAMRKVLAADLDKDLTKIPLIELPEHLGSVLAV